MSIYPSLCAFTPAGQDLSNATLGWDAVYAVKYSTLNQALSASANPPPPWVQHGPLNVGGFVNQGMLQNAPITNVQIVQGGTGQTLRWHLDAMAAGYMSAEAGVPSINAPFRLDIVLDTQLRIIEDAVSPGLLHVKVDTPSLNPNQLDPGFNPPVVRSIKINPADIATAGLTPIQLIAIEAFITQIVSSTLQVHYGALFNTTPLSSILTQAFAKEVDIPWLNPTVYRAAAKDLPLNPQDGILAVLMMTEDRSPDGLDVSVSGLAFPTNSDVNAAVILKSDLLARTTLLTQLNQELANSTFGSITELKEEPGVLANENPISLGYRIDENNGQATLILIKAVSESKGMTFAASIAPGALRFEIAKGAINVNMTEVRVKLEGNNTLVLSMRSSFGLVVNPLTQEIDISLDGTPHITSHFEAPKESGWLVWAQYGAILGSIIVGEVGAFFIDKLSGMYANVSDKRMEAHLDDYFAALRQSEKENRPVEIDIGLKRTMIVDYRPGEPGTVIPGERTSKPLNPSYRKALQLNTAYPDGMPQPAARPGVIELTENPGGQQGTHPNVLTEPMNDSHLPLAGDPHRHGDGRARWSDGRLIKIKRPRVRNNVGQIEREPLVLDAHGSLEPEEPLNAPRQPLRQFDRDQVLRQGSTALKAEWLIADVLYLTRADPSLREELINTCAGLVSDATHRSVFARALNEIANQDHIQHERNTRLGEISHIANLPRYAYEGTVKCLNAWLKSGKITVAEYHLIVQQFPEFSQEPELAKGAGIRQSQQASHIHVETRAKWRDDGHPAPMLLAQLDAAERAIMIEREGQQAVRGNAALNRALMRQIMQDDARPAWLHVAGIAGYLATLAIGYFGGNAVSNALAPSSPAETAADRNKSEKVTNAVAAAPSSIIFNAVTFPLMARHMTGGVVDPAVPPPATVLKCAAVNGGLVLGVSIV